MASAFDEGRHIPDISLASVISSQRHGRRGHRCGLLQEALRLNQSPMAGRQGALRWIGLKLGNQPLVLPNLARIIWMLSQDMSGRGFVSVRVEPLSAMELARSVEAEIALVC